MDLEELMNQDESKNPAPGKKPSPLVSLEEDLKFYAEAIKEVSTDILVEGISQFPIFIAHQHEVSIGEKILDKNDLNTQWTIQASTLEEFVEKGIILTERKQNFIKSYKKPQEFMCVFVVVPEGANFIFYPFA